MSFEETAARPKDQAVLPLLEQFLRIQQEMKQDSHRGTI
jgi:hypothetical protein